MPLAYIITRSISYKLIPPPTRHKKKMKKMTVRL